MRIQNESADLNVTEEIPKKFQQYRSNHPDLITKLRNIGIGPAFAVKIIETFGVDNVVKTIFKDNPYRLMDIEGFGFLRADAIAVKNLGLSPDDPRRSEALILYVLETNRAFGHVYLPSTILDRECKKYNVKDFPIRLQEMIKAGKLIIEENRIYDAGLYAAEVETACMILARVKNI